MRSCSTGRSAARAIGRLVAVGLTGAFLAAACASTACADEAPVGGASSARIASASGEADSPAVFTDAEGQPLSAGAGDAFEVEGVVSVSEDFSASTLEHCDFGIESFSRQNKGTNRAVGGVSIGYRWPMASERAFALVATRDAIIVYVPASVASELGVDISDKRFQSRFLSQVEALDRGASSGGALLDPSGKTCYFTSSKTVLAGAFSYGFAQEAEGSFYATSRLDDSDDASAGGLFMETGLLKPAADVVVVEKPEGAAAVAAFFSSLDWSPLWVSLRTTGAAIVFIFILGLFAAWATMRVSDRLKGVLDTLFTIPMVLPPTVCGFLLLLLFGNSTATGRWLIEHGIDVVFTWQAAVIACVVVGFPMMYRTVRGAFENLDAAMLDAARTLGWGEAKVFFRLMLPLAWPSIAAGTVLAFARAMGEFGCTLFFAGNYAGITQTIPIAIYFDWMGGKSDVALFWVLVVIVLSFLVILLINVYSSRTQRFKKRLGD